MNLKKRHNQKKDLEKLTINSIFMKVIMNSIFKNQCRIQFNFEFEFFIQFYLYVLQELHDFNFC